MSNITKEINDLVRREVSKLLFEMDCPKCNTIIRVHEGHNVCPNCGEYIKITLDIAR